MLELCDDLVATVRTAGNSDLRLHLSINWGSGCSLIPHILEALLRMRVAVAGRREFAEAELPG